MSLEINGIKLHNRFDIEIEDAKTGKIKQKVQAENIILNQWWTRLFSNSEAPVRYIAFGSGSGTPSVSDVNLFHQEGRVDASWTTNKYKRERYATATTAITLTEQQYVGVTFSEIGIKSSSEYLTTHAMLTDMNGNSVSIVKTDADIFHIHATVYCHWDANTDHRMTWDNYVSPLMSFALGKTSSFNGSNISYYKGFSYNTYNLMTEKGSISWTTQKDLANKKVTYTVRGTSSRIPVGNGNGDSSYDAPYNRGGGIAFVYVTGPELVMPVEDFYPGDDIVGEAIGTGDGTKARFYTRFDFPENAKIYVDGVRVTNGVTVRRCGGAGYVDNNKPVQRNLGKYITTLASHSTPNCILYDYRNINYQHQSEYVSILPSTSSTESNEKFINVFQNLNNAIGFAEVRLNTLYIVQDDTFYHQKLYGSNDLSNWTFLYETPDFSAGGYNQYNGFRFTFDESNRHYKYYKIEYDGVKADWVKYGQNWTNALSADFFNRVYRSGSYVDLDDGCQIIFDTPPANGAVITADYHTPLIAKDSDHVLDFGGYAFTFDTYSE